MKPGWPSVIKICGGLVLLYFAGGLVYRFVYLQGSDIDLERFISYVSAAILMLISDQVMKRFLLRHLKKTAPSLSAKEQADEFYEKQQVYLGHLYGGLLPIARWPLVLLTIAPIAALWGQKWADGFERLVLNLLGLESMTRTSSKLIFFSAWFLIGTLILNLGFRFYLMRSSNPGSTEPA
jgi:hypothetical protein